MGGPAVDCVIKPVGQPFSAARVESLKRAARTHTVVWTQRRVARQPIAFFLSHVRAEVTRRYLERVGYRLPPVTLDQEIEYDR